MRGLLVYMRLDRTSRHDVVINRVIIVVIIVIILYILCASIFCRLNNYEKFFPSNVYHHRGEVYTQNDVVLL